MGPEVYTFVLDSLYSTQIYIRPTGRENLTTGLVI